MSILVIYEILGLFVNTLPADDRYSFRNSENLRQLIEIQLSKKQKKFSQLFASLLKSKSNFESFENRKNAHTLCISEIMDCEMGDSIND